MQLVFEVCDNASGAAPARKLFDCVGGVIGRGLGCDWIIPDAQRLISSHHALVSFRDGRYFLTDISSNGIGVSGSVEQLRKGQARLINEGDVYRLGSMEIRARLLRDEQPRFARSDTIPSDAFLGLDPVQALEVEQRRVESSQELEALDTSTRSPAQPLREGAVDRDHLVVPQWAEPAREGGSPLPEPFAPAASAGFWSEFGEALGMRLETLDTPGREALAIQVAGLLRQAVEGLQQCVRTRDELNSEVNLGWSTPTPRAHNPLKDGADTQATLASLLGAGESGQLPAGLAVAEVCRELQVHQLALVVACRAAMRSALAAFAPGHLLLCFEREGNPRRILTDGGHWRAYQRHYRRLNDEADLGEQLLRSDFTKAYEEQVRLVSLLHTVYPG
ncbi:type VI secretion system-associated FHA domain protein TagH [Pseudomonas sp.]|uniref:type VI secretion system-associated FHA domain protein TagH n=1 Tax=Pseudomonas sp. TaxID=306 RepID=UPI003C450FC9